ncbi:MAG: serine hydrolase [Bacteroidota bacterium]
MWKYTLTLLTFLLWSSISLFAQLDKKTLSRIDQAVSNAFETFEPTGLAVAVVKDGQIVYKKALGKASVEAGTDLQTTSLFNVASCSKAFTAAAMGMLVDEGQVKWTDKVTDHLPDFRMRDPYITQQIDLTDILSHRSGLGTFVGDLLWYGTDYTDEEVLDRLKNLPIDNGFRRSYGYSNLMFLTAGEVIEAASGQPWSEFMEERFFAPLSMTSTRPSSDELGMDANQNLAFPHIDGKIQPIYDWNAAKAAASIYSNVEDMSQWMLLLLDNGKIGEVQMIKPNTLDYIFRMHTPLTVSRTMRSWGIHFRGYGLGWFMMDYGGKKVLEHDGGMPGYISKVALIPEENLGVVVLNNGMHFYVDEAVKLAIFDAVLGKDTKDWNAEFKVYEKGYENYSAEEEKRRMDRQQANTQPSVALKDFVGSYTEQNYGYGTGNIDLEGVNLTIALSPNSDAFTGTMSHFHHNTFKVQFNDAFLPFALITFEQGVDGKINGFTIECPISDFHFDNLHYSR